MPAYRTATGSRVTAAAAYSTERPNLLRPALLSIPGFSVLLFHWISLQRATRRGKPPVPDERQECSHIMQQLDCDNLCSLTKIKCLVFRCVLFSELVFSFARNRSLQDGELNGSMPRHDCNCHSPTTCSSFHGTTIIQVIISKAPDQITPQVGGNVLCTSLVFTTCRISKFTWTRAIWRASTMPHATHTVGNYFTHDYVATGNL